MSPRGGIVGNGKGKTIYWDYETGDLREIQPYQRKVLDMIESRCTVSLHPRKMIMMATPTRKV